MIKGLEQPLVTGSTVNLVPKTGSSFMKRLATEGPESSKRSAEPTAHRGLKLHELSR